MIALDQGHPRLGARARSLLSRPEGRGLVVVVAAFIVSQLAYAAAGVRFDATSLHPTGQGEDLWQMLDTPLLTHDLVSSLWYLHSQPPLFNLFCGVLLHLPLGLQQPVAAACFWFLGLLLAGSTYLLLLELRVPTWAATIVALVVVANPAAILYENWLSWSYPAAVLLTVGAYCCARFLRTRRSGWGVGCFACFGAVVLDDSTFQWIWLLAALAAIIFFMRPAWRQVMVVAAVPLLLVGGWYVKNAVLFGTTTTSSWFGMNLASTTIAIAPKAQIQKLVHEGRLTPIAAKEAFGPVSRYEPTFVQTRPTGVRALDARIKSDGGINYNNVAYVAVSSQYLRDDLAYIRAEPGDYAGNVALGAEVWFVPADQYPLPSDSYADNYARISGYARLYDTVILWQADRTIGAGFLAAARGTTPSPGVLSYSTMVEYALALLLAPFVIIRRRQRRVLAGTLAVMWLTVAYSFLTTSLVSLGDNMRFQFELGSLPLVMAVAVVASFSKSASEPCGQDAQEGSSGGDASPIATHASMPNDVMLGEPLPSTTARMRPVRYSASWFLRSPSWILRSASWFLRPIRA